MTAETEPAGMTEEARKMAVEHPPSSIGTCGYQAAGRCVMEGPRDPSAGRAQLWRPEQLAAQIL